MQNSGQVTVAIKKCLLLLQIFDIPANRSLCLQDLHAHFMLNLVIVLFKDLQLSPAWKFTNNNDTYDLVQCTVKNISDSRTNIRITCDINNAKALVDDHDLSRKGIFGTASKDTKDFIIELKKALAQNPETIQSVVHNFIKNRFDKGNYSEDYIIPLLLKHKLITRDVLDVFKQVDIADIQWNIL